ncbi:MAG: cupin domain-containing protein [Lachnospiraceae bacterium]|nr:cupin domain-containing protein [Lachnospiraceae bacterium]
MNYILLSGGSGKRLWPLSNEIRSKQFIKILKKDDGTFESMVERVYRQIKNVDNDSNVTIATSETQVPMLKNQLGDNIDISIEPCRRDTFPAIVLACMYLKDVKKIDENDTVVVSPVDPYVDDDYFKTLKILDERMKISTNNIGLVGIKPTYPSEKYGYIVPCSGEFNGERFVVDRFVEKPSLTEARKLIEAGALWNGGVFCFKLKYIIKIAHELIDFNDYNDLFNKYEKVLKISFDYAVVEKEKNIDVVCYDGEWRDIGTWNTLTEVMSEKSIGNVLFDEKSDNSNIINELDIPIIGMGLKNIVVAASHDGIFVSDKNESSYNKELVEKLNNRPMYEERAWGDFKILDIYSPMGYNIDNKNIQKSLVKHLYIKSGKAISYQRHKFRDEVWTIIDGSGTLTLNGVEKNVKAGDVVTIKKGDKHSLKAIEDLHFVEVQIGQELSEDDIERF